MTDDRTIPHDFEQLLADALGKTLPDPPPHLDRHIREAVLDVLEHRNDPRIPEELLSFDEHAWRNQTDPSREHGSRRIDAWQRYNAACMKWCTDHGIWTGAWEPLRDRQIAERERQQRTKQAP